MSNSVSSGVEFYALQLAMSIEPANLSKWINEISIVIKSMGGQSIVPTRIGRSEPMLRRNGSLVISEPMDEGVSRAATARLVKLATEHKVSAIIAYDAQSLNLAHKICKSWKAPVIFMCQEIIQPSGLFSRGNSKIKFDQINHFIVPSIAAGDHLMTNFRIEKHRISVVREGIDLESISDQAISQERTMSLAHAWGVIEKVVEIVLIPECYSSPKWQQNLINFMDAWSKLGRDDAHFVVMGDDASGTIMAQMHSRILRQNPLASIQFVGHCADVDAAIKLSSLVLEIQTDDKVSFPISLLAQAIGRSVILPNSPVSEEFCKEGSSGEIAPDDADLLANLVGQKIRREEGERLDQALAGRVFVSQNNSRDVMHASLKDIFESDTIS